MDGQEEKAQLFLQKKMREIGLETKLCEPDYTRLRSYAHCPLGHSYAGRPNLVGALRGSGDAGRSLILNGHVDTMAAENRETWKYDPWSVAIKGDTIYSVGACDMKAGLAAMLFAVGAVARHGRLRGDVLLQSVVDEEGGGNGTLDLVAQGYTAAAIIAEPTELRIMAASRGVLVTHIHVTGEARHPNYKWTKANAVEKAFHIWQALHALEHRWLATKNHPTLPRPTITLGKIQGGVAGTAIPAACDMYLDVEFLPEEYALDGSCKKTTGDDIKRELDEAIMRASAADEWLSAHPPNWEVYQHVEPHSVDTGFPLIHILQENHGQAPFRVDSHQYRNAGYCDQGKQIGQIRQNDCYNRKRGKAGGYDTGDAGYDQPGQEYGPHIAKDAQYLCE